MDKTIEVVDVNEMWEGTDLHVRIKGVKIWQIRLWLMAKLIYLAARIGGCGLEIETTFTNKEKIDG